MSDAVTAPRHYIRNGYECRYVMRAMMNGVSDYVTESGERKPIPPSAYGWWQQAGQYLWRWFDKGGIEDLEKCQQSIDYLIEELRRAGSRLGTAE